MLTPLEMRVLALITMFKDQLPLAEIDDMKQLVQVGERGIALETLSSQLYEYNIAVKSDVVDEIESLGKAMGLDSIYWLCFRPDFVPRSTEKK